MSRDGSALAFTASIEGVPRLYLRRNSQTAWVSESEATASEPPARAVFREISADGSKVYFTSPQQLVDAVPAATGAEELYMYTDGPDPTGERNLTLLSTDEEPADGDETGVLGVLGISHDGRRVYFAATGDLLPSVPATVAPSEPKIYLWNEGQLSFVGATTALSNWERVAPHLAPSGWDTSRVSDDGGALLYATRDESRQGELGPTAFHLFTLSTRKTVCVSCPGGRSPRIGATLATQGNRDNASRNTVPRALSSDGKRVFFSTPEALVREDTNGVEDAYEYDATDGRLSLVSSGRGTTPSFFAGANASGSEVFILTGDHLVGRDEDGLEDLYVARAGGGFPETAKTSSECASGAECRGQVGEEMAAGGIGSASTVAAHPARHRRPKHRKTKKRRHVRGKHRAQRGSRSKRHHREGSK
jgi:hypothetical protein